MKALAAEVKERGRRRLAAEGRHMPEQGIRE
jgi:hypothetical protein